MFDLIPEASSNLWSHVCAEPESDLSNESYFVYFGFFKTMLNYLNFQ